MDLFGKKKIEQLKRQLEKLEFTISNLHEDYEHVKNEKNQNNEEIERLKAIIRGERVCDGYCKHCKNSIAIKVSTFVMGNWRSSESYTCALDCKCKDFQKAE